MSSIRGVLFDLDGTLYTAGEPLPGAVEAVAELRRRGLAVGFVTNTTSRSRRHLHERLERIGIPAAAEQIVTALRAGAVWLAEQATRRIAPYVPDLAMEDLSDFEVDHAHPEAVVIGDLDDRWDFAILNRAFRQVMDGARLVALSRDRYWDDGDGLVLDCGPFVAALEYASGREATVCGKPSAAFYHAALATLGPWALERPELVLMVGDDVWADVEGAQRAGLRACLIRTGKFREDALAASGVRPDVVLASVAEVPALLGGR
jgi:HAD superfamily hydrolase (TIGR01458 family)